MGADEDLFRFVTSASIACGFHAGDPAVMQRTISLAARLNVCIGAHPGFPDLVGFGRRQMALSPDDVYSGVLYQIGALSALAKAQGQSVRYVKAHGALYNQAARDEKLAFAIVEAAASFSEDLAITGLPSSAMEEAAGKLGLPFAAEVFADRAYLPDGTLVPRTRTGAILSEPDEVARRAVAMVTRGGTEATSGEWVPLRTDTICVHGDSPHAVAMASAVREALVQAGVTLRPFVSR